MSSSFGSHLSSLSCKNIFFTNLGDKYFPSAIGYTFKKYPNERENPSISRPFGYFLKSVNLEVFLVNEKIYRWKLLSLFVFDTIWELFSKYKSIWIKKHCCFIGKYNEKIIGLLWSVSNCKIYEIRVSILLGSRWFWEVHNQIILINNRYKIGSILIIIFISSFVSHFNLLNKYFKKNIFFV